MKKVTLTAELAEAHLKRGLDVSTCRTLEPEAAEILSHFKEGLRLDGLVELGLESAKHLAMHGGRYLLLGGLTAIDQEIAEVLAEYRGGLALDGLVSISDEAANAFSKHKSSLGTGDPSARHATFGAVARVDDFDEGFALFNVDLVDQMVAYSPGFLLLGGIRSLSDKAAEALAQHDGWIDFRGLESVSIRAAKAFAARSGPTSIGISKISDAVGVELAKAKGLLNLDFVTQLSGGSFKRLKANRNISLVTAEETNETLTAEIARQLCEPSVSGEDMRTYTSIDNDAAVILGEQYHKSNWAYVDLNLNGLNSLATPAAIGLAKFHGAIYLCGLEDITLPIAKALSKCSGNLYLDGITALTDLAASALAKHSATLSLQGLVNISSKGALSLAGHGRVSLGPVEDLDAAVIEALATGCREFPFGHVDTLTSSVANVAAKYDGDITFYNIKDIPAEYAPILAQHQGTLCLVALEKLDPKTARLLLKHQGRIELPRLKSINAETAQLLYSTSQDYIELPALQEIGSKAATILAKFNGELHLNGLRSLSRELAEAISGNASLILNAIEDIDVEVAKHLVKASGGIELGSTNLSAEVIDELAKSPNMLSLSGLSTLSVEAAASLSRHAGELYLNGVAEVSDKVILQLAKHAGPVHLGLDDKDALSDVAKEVLASNPQISCFD